MNHNNGKRPDGSFMFIRGPVGSEYSDSVAVVQHNYGECKFSLAGGAIEEGESSFQAAIREAEEETPFNFTGLSVTHIGILKSNKSDHKISIFETRLIEPITKKTLKFQTAEIRQLNFIPLVNRVLYHMKEEIFPGQMVAILKTMRYLKGNYGNRQIDGFLSAPFKYNPYPINWGK